MSDSWFTLHHVSIPRPAGDEAAREARHFYGQLVRLREIPVPSSLSDQGLIWYALGDSELHIFVGATAHPSAQHHLCIALPDVASLRKRLEQAGYYEREPTPIPGRPRFFARDPFSNLLEFTTILA